MSNQRVMRVSKVELSSSAEHEISHAAYKEVQQWLTSFTCAANFKAVIGDFDDCIKILRDDMKTNLVPGWLVNMGVKPEHFVFFVSGDRVVDGRFWSNFGMGSLTPHRIY